MTFQVTMMPSESDSADVVSFRPVLFFLATLLLPRNVDP
jgi:hypothetical protein